MNLEVTQSCALLTDSALQLLKEDVSECCFWVFCYYQCQYNLELQCIRHSYSTSYPIFFFLAYLLLFHTLWSHMLLSVQLKPTTIGGINKVACISVRIKIMVTLHNNWIAQDSTRGNCSPILATSIWRFSGSLAVLLNSITSQLLQPRQRSGEVRGGVVIQVRNGTSA